MTPRTEQKLKEIATYFDLRIEYVAELPDNVHGVLEPDLRCIIVNAHKARSDHALTIAHELAHYIRHLDRQPKLIIIPWFLNRPWKSQLMMEAAQMHKDFIHRIHEPEVEADLWAFILLLLIGAGDDLVAITELYPEKTWMLWFALAALIYILATQPSKLFFPRFFHSFSSS